MSPMSIHGTMQEQQHTTMSPSDHQSSSSSRQLEGRAPLQTVLANPPIGSHLMGGGIPGPQAYQHQSSYRSLPAKATGNHNSNTTNIRPHTTRSDRNLPVESFELEHNNTASSGGTAWTLRLPWLRGKRHRNKQQMVRLDDDNSSIGTNPSLRQEPGTTRSSTTPTGRGEHQQDAGYYGGLMKTTAYPSTPHQNANNSASGTYDYSHHSQQQPQQQQQTMEQHPAAQQQHKPLDSQHDSLKGRSQHSILATSANYIDQSLLPLHSAPPPPYQNTSAGAAAATSSSRRFSMSPAAPAEQPEPQSSNKVSGNRSWLSASTSGGSRNDARQKRQRGGRRGAASSSASIADDSLDDFNEDEWTPQDSAYGAAIPVCGWVPKRLRQFIEATLIAITVFGLVYLVVTTSINIQEGKLSGEHKTYNGSYVDSKNQFDDDWYVEYSSYANDEDDYFNSNSYAANGDDNGRG